MITRLLACAAILLLANFAPAQQTLAELDLPEIEVQPWQFDGFPILAWWAPPGTATLQDFVNYREAGFTLCTVNPDAGFYDAIDLATQAVLPMMVYRIPQGFQLEPLDTTTVNWPTENENVVGWITHDEPHSEQQVATAITAVNELMQNDPSRWALFNLLPPPGQPPPGTKAAIDAAVANGLPILSYDQYSLHADGSENLKFHYDSLELLREASLEHDRPFWAFALTIKHFHYRRTSESDLRWNQYANLAYGAKGLWYFTYWAPNNWDRWDNKAIVTHTGDKTELYEYVKTLNHKVLEMGDLLLALTNTDVVHTHPPEGHRGFTKNVHWIADIDARQALIGFFRDPDGNEYALVVNALHGKDKSARETADLVHLRFASNVESVEAVNWLDGLEGPLTIVNGKTWLPILGGTGVMLKAKIKK